VGAFAAETKKRGFTDRELEMMFKDNPARAIGLSGGTSVRGLTSTARRSMILVFAGASARIVFSPRTKILPPEHPDVNQSGERIPSRHA